MVDPLKVRKKILRFAQNDIVRFGTDIVKFSKEEVVLQTGKAPCGLL